MSEPTIDELFGRGREAAIEVLKFLLAIATAILGVFFVALTGKDRICLLGEEVTPFYLTIWSMVSCVACGVLGWVFHALFYSAWADGAWAEAEAKRAETQAEKEKAEAKAAKRKSSQKIWGWARKTFFALSILFFIVGISLSGLYISRASERPCETESKKG